jgi:hypothetical protein
VCCCCWWLAFTIFVCVHAWVFTGVCAQLFFFSAKVTCSYSSTVSSENNKRQPGHHGCVFCTSFFSVFFSRDNISHFVSGFSREGGPALFLLASLFMSPHSSPSPLPLLRFAIPPIFSFFLSYFFVLFSAFCCC